MQQNETELTKDEVDRANASLFAADMWFAALQKQMSPLELGVVAIRLLAQTIVCKSHGADDAMVGLEAAVVGLRQMIRDHYKLPLTNAS